MVRRRADYGADVERDTRALGESCDVLTAVFFTPLVEQILGAHDIAHLGDLGCGGGRMLIDLCERNPRLRGTGIDIAPPAIELAKQQAAASPARDRLRFLVGDAFAPQQWPEECRTADGVVAVG